ncbi:epoxyqueuosine reductase QueH, partial [Candidatus Auribacterota bacterium]
MADKERNIPGTKPRLLLHACCAVCSSSVCLALKDSYDITLYFYNPNIHPKLEYLKRLQAMKELSGIFSVPLAEDIYDDDRWTSLTSDTKGEPEGGKRCEACIRIRLERTHQYAIENNFDHIGTVLSVSPHKNAQLINNIGTGICADSPAEFLR